jgi:hypothetical protein
MTGTGQDNMGQFFDFGSISLPEVEESHVTLSNTSQLQPAGGDLLPDLSNAHYSTYMSNCSVHPFEP